MSQITIDTLCDEGLIRQMQRAAAFGKQKLALAKEERPFCIVVCGVFSSGKSSLINALLGTELPTGIFPVTKVVTKIRYGTHGRIVVKEISSGSEWEISGKDAEGIITNQDNNEGLQDYQIFIESPSEFLKDNIMVIDTPGMDDDKKENLDEITREEIRNADFCIINYVSNKFAQSSEREFLEQMQELTHGNFVSVLNCLNYLQQGEAQLEDLEKRAKHVLGDYGNERIGKGRYFRVDSKDKDNAFLDGLDSWLREMIAKYRKILQADTPLTMAHSELKRIKKDCDERIPEIVARMKEIQEMNQSVIKSQKRQQRLSKDVLLSKVHEAAIQEKDRLTATLTDDLRPKLKEFWGNAYVDTYRIQVKALVDSLVLTFADQMVERTAGENGMFPNCRPGYLLSGEFKECLVSYTVSLPSYQERERGVLDLNRYLFGKTYRVYTNYAGDTIQEILSTLLPRLKIRIDEYFKELGEIVAGKDIVVLSGGYEGDLAQLEDYYDRLSTVSLDSLEVLHDVRKLRDQLVAAFSEVY